MSKMPMIAGHRGASHNAPENTHAAFVLAWMQGADAIEGDFRMTKDHRIVCIHDETTGRTTNRNMIVAKATLEALQQLDAGGWMASQWRGQKIPTLEEVLAGIPEGKHLFLEMKAGVEMLAPLKQVLDQSPVNPGRVVLMSFDTEVLQSARALFPTFKILMLMNRKRGAQNKPLVPSTQEMIDAMVSMNLDGLNCGAPGLIHDRDCAPQVLAAGKEVHAWTVNRPGNAMILWKMGASSINTDRPGWLKQNLLLRQ
jgi:glycerophosphoryl diester phosphodiesterase